MWKRLKEFIFIHDETNPIHNQGVSSLGLEVCKQRRVFFRFQSCFWRERPFASTQNSPQLRAEAKALTKTDNPVRPVLLPSQDGRVHFPKMAAPLHLLFLQHGTGIPPFAWGPCPLPRNLGRPMTLVDVPSRDFQNWVRKGDKALSSSLWTFPLGAQSPWCEEAQAAWRPPAEVPADSQPQPRDTQPQPLSA